MTNYGYTCSGWSAEKKGRLAAAWAKLLEPYSAMSPCPTVEVDGLYPGVRMRQLTWIPQMELDALIVQADAAYDRVIVGCEGGD